MVPNPAKPPERAPPKPPERPRIVRLLNLARDWQAKIDRGELRTRAQIAALSGLSAVWVGHILDLLKLHPSILEHIEQLKPGDPERRLTERLLRPITKVPLSEQLEALGDCLEADSRSVG